MTTLKMRKRMLAAALFSVGWLAFMQIEAFLGESIDMNGNNLILVWVAYLGVMGAIHGAFLSGRATNGERYFNFVLAIAVAIGLVRSVSLIHDRVELGSELIMAAALFFIGYFFSVAAEHIRR